MAESRNRWRAGLGVLTLAAALCGCATEREPPFTELYGVLQGGSQMFFGDERAAIDQAIDLSEYSGDRRIVSLHFPHTGPAAVLIRDRVLLDDKSVRTRDYEIRTDAQDNREFVLASEWVSPDGALFDIAAELVRLHAERRDDLTRPIGNAFEFHFAHGLLAYGTPGLWPTNIGEILSGEGRFADSAAADDGHSVWDSENARPAKPSHAYLLNVYMELFDSLNTLPSQRIYPAPGDEPEGG